jgi:hypothetical protein
MMDKKLVIYDTPYKTIDETIDVIWDITEHEEIQCEQIAFTMACTGKAIVKEGDIEELEYMAEYMMLNGFITEIL